MNRSKIINIIDLVFNFSLFVLGLVGFYFFNFAAGNGYAEAYLWHYNILSTNLILASAILMAVANLANIMKGKNCTPRFFFTLRYVSAVMGLLTLIMTAIFLRQDGYSDDELLSLNNGALLMNFVIPIISLVEFGFVNVEPKAKPIKMFEPLIVNIAYCIGIFIGIGIEGINFAPYPFFLMTEEACQQARTANPPLFPGIPNAYDPTSNTAAFIFITILSLIIALVVWLINRFNSMVIIGVDYKEVYKKNEIKEEKNAGFGDGFGAYLKSKFAFIGINSETDYIYNIFYNIFKKEWVLVTMITGEKPKFTKLKSENECIEEAEKLNKNNPGPILLHTMLGRLTRSINKNKKEK